MSEPVAPSPEAKEADWGGLRPVRAKPHEVRGTDDAERPLVSVLLPRFRNRVLRRWAERASMAPFRLRLDAVGSYVWLRCDGDTTVSALGESLVAQFGERVEPVDERLTTFLGQLSRGGLVELRETPSPATE